MGCCCGSSSTSVRPILEVDLPTGELMRLPAPATFAILEDVIKKKLRSSKKIKIHHDSGMLTAENYQEFLKTPTRLLVEALDVAMKRDSPERVRTARWLSDSETPYQEPAAEPYLVDVEKGELSVLRTGTRRAKVYKSSLIQWESRVAVLNEKLIVTGGKGNGRECLVVDLASGRVGKGSQMMEARLSHATAVLDDAVYAIGGYSNEEMRSCEVYTNNEWFPGGSLNCSRSFHTAVAFQGWVYVCGGTKESTCEVLENSRWRLLAVQLPVFLSRPGIAPYNAGKLLIAGGEILRGGVKSEYNTAVYLLDVGYERLQAITSLPEPACFTHSGTCKDSAAILFNIDSIFAYKSGAWTVTRMEE